MRTYSKLLALLAAAAVVVPPGPAGASAPQITDPPGDAYGILGILQPLTILPLPSDPTVDLLSGEVSVGGGNLSFVVSVVDLVSTAPSTGDGRRFWFDIHHGDGQTVVNAFITPTTTEFSGYYASFKNDNTGTVDLPMTGSLDTVANTVTINVDLDDLAAAIDEAGEGQDQPFGSGTVVRAEGLQSWYLRSTPFGFLSVDFADGAVSDNTYVVP